MSSSECVMMTSTTCCCLEYCANHRDSSLVVLSDCSSILIMYVDHRCAAGQFPSRASHNDLCRHMRLTNALVVRVGFIYRLPGHSSLRASGKIPSISIYMLE
jgi:hypothetical protein